ncbi:hypothetical protein QAD02_016855 [Eretmocerus hayati]|uniref:Uncharacterized protein n=1 Tax=Eretmocerus hayati TaxID=131215 RepID=A0ACC2PC94_9HYME|nr:hypothetical protein QAD02_016855 [Eretmocerus hayati]
MFQTQKRFSHYRAQLYVKSTRHFDDTWIIGIFSPRTWYTVVIFFILFSMVGVCVKYLSDLRDSGYDAVRASEVFFYCFGVICNRGDEYYNIYGINQTLSFTIGMFSWLLLSAYSSQIYVSITQTMESVPFRNLQEMYYKSDYIITNNANRTYLGPIAKEDMGMQKLLDAQRYKHFEDYRSTWFAACSSEHKYAVVQKNTVSFDYDVPCDLKAVGQLYSVGRVAGGIPKKFKYKKTINNGIIKMREFGIMRYLKDKWLYKVIYDRIELRSYSPIVFEQVFAVVIVYLIGVFLSMAIFLHEYYHQKYDSLLRQGYSRASELRAKARWQNFQLDINCGGTQLALRDGNDEAAKAMPRVNEL